jgi:hypothetical protein
MNADHIIEVGAVLVALAIGSASAVKVMIKRAQAKRMRRKELIAIWRHELLSSDQDSVHLPASSGGFAFMQLPAYTSLRSHLSKPFRDHLESERQIIQFIIEEGRIVGIAGDYPYKQLADEISRIEREWRLTLQ